MISSGLTDNEVIIATAQKGKRLITIYIKNAAIDFFLTLTMQTTLLNQK
jgi:hypothetical protein